MAFDLSDYQTVQERIEIFWRLYPTGRIVNKIVRLDDKGVVVRCSVWRNTLEPQWAEPDAVDYAQENISERGINSTSYVENCTSSATGRALSLLGGELSPSKKRASRNEMEKVQRVLAKHFMDEANLYFGRGSLDELRELYTEAKEKNLDSATIAKILELGQRLAKEKTPAGKEQTTEVQA